jgi:hypothetical protein
MKATEALFYNEEHIIVVMNVTMPASNTLLVHIA